MHDRPLYQVTKLFKQQEPVTYDNMHNCNKYDDRLCGLVVRVPGC
jgi:hypothetical protein